MHQTAEHDMRHLCELPGDRGANMGMIIAVTGGPPARDPVDQLAAIGENNPASLPCAPPVAN